jgi:predicted ATP-grasp superfamily ATP-dependent carboligase
MQPPAPFVGSLDQGRQRDQPLILLGASVRAAAQSARRAGISVIGVDLFGDTDTIAACDRFVRLEAIGDLPGLLSSLPPAPVMQVGGLTGGHGLLADGGLFAGEGLLADAANRQRVLGPSPQLGRKLGDPRVLAEIARNSGLSFPCTIRTPCHPADTPRPESRQAGIAGQANATEMPLSLRWLRKDPHQSGGLGVRWAGEGRNLDEATPDASPRTSDPEQSEILSDYGGSRIDEVRQQWIAGRSYGVSFLGDGESSWMLGICRSVFCRRGRLPFVYAGSTGPTAVGQRLAESFGQLGQCLTDMGVRGLFGADVIVDRLGRGWLLEINPRWTASSELVERSMQRRGMIPANRSLISIARDAFFGSLKGSLGVIDDAAGATEDRSVRFKRIVYARRDLRIDTAALAPLTSMYGHDRCSIELCDLPADGSQIRSGDPILTLIATVQQASDRVGSARWPRQLRWHVREIQQQLGG